MSRWTPGSRRGRARSPGKPRTRARFPYAASLAVAVVLAAMPARAQDVVLSGTLRTIEARGTILIGYRDGALPFSFRNQAGQPIGFSIDLCHEIAAEAATALGLDLLEPDAPSWRTGLRIAYLPVTPDAWLPLLAAGGLDLECGPTTATDARARSVAFSPVFFLAGTKLMAPLAAGVSSYRDLAGRTLVVGAGTTNARIVQRLAATVSPPIHVVETPTLDDAYDLLAAGKADAFASDNILLSGFIATHPGGERFAVMGDYLSFEPYAIAFRRDDPGFAALVRSSFTRLATASTLASLYDRWLVDRLPTGQTLGLPISPQLSEMYSTLGQAD